MATSCSSINYYRVIFVHTTKTICSSSLFFYQYTWNVNIDRDYLGLVVMPPIRKSINCTLWWMLRTAINNWIRLQRNTHALHISHLLLERAIPTMVGLSTDILTHFIHYSVHVRNIHHYLTVLLLQFFAYVNSIAWDKCSLVLICNIRVYYNTK